MAGEIYFDNNATTRVLPEVVEAMVPFLTEFYGNPSSIHRFGSQVGEKLSEARAQVAALIGAADPVEVIFTGSGTEGDNAAIRGMLEDAARQAPYRDHAGRALGRVRSVPAPGEKRLSGDLVGRG